MYNRRLAANVDKNQKPIVKALRQIAGVTVETNHDDLLVGYKNCTFWFELKSERAANKDGKVFDCELKPKQKDLLKNWKGHYAVVTNIDQILSEIGIKK